MRVKRPMPPAVADRLAADLAGARSSARMGDSAQAWRLLEEAHILSQPWARPHVRVHVAMAGRGWRLRDRHEVLGQLLRIVVAGPGSLTGRYPEGNTGRASVPATAPMPVPEELRALLGSPSP
ncbi:MAG: DUF3703 domain-containing protein [Acidimicrobiales bacterium]